MFSFQFDHLFTFSALNLMPHLTTPFVLSFILRIVIQRLKVSSMIFEVLNDSSAFSRHTGVCHTYPNPEDTSKYVSYRYSSSDKRQHPFGITFPSQCVACKGIGCFDMEKMRGGGKGSKDARTQCLNCGEDTVIYRPANLLSYTHEWGVYSWEDKDGSPDDESLLVTSAAESD